MATTDKTKTALAEQEKPVGILSLIQGSIAELGKALPEHLRGERLARIATTLIRLNPKLMSCTPESFLGALFTAAQLGIEPVAGRAYILPFYNSRKKADGTWHKLLEAQFIMGYKGVADLFFRHDRSVMLNWGVVTKNDEFDYEYGTQAFLKHRPAKDDRGPVLGFYVIAELTGNAKPFMYMTLDDCLDHGRKHSKTFDKKTQQFFEDSPWTTSTDSMCLKTVLLQLAKLLPLSYELQRALEADETSREYRKGITDALDLPTTTNWTDSQIEAPAKQKDPNDPGEPPPEPTGKSSDPEIAFGK